MRVRDLERMLASNGASASKLDAVTRLLRESGRLPTGGRGPNAPHIDFETAAIVLIATAGSSKAINSIKRLKLLEQLESSVRTRRKLPTAFAELLSSPKELKELAEVQIGRNVRRAAFIFFDGTTTIFLPKPTPDYSSRFIVEGKLPGPLLSTIAQMIVGKTGVPDVDSSDEPDDDA